MKIRLRVWEPAADLPDLINFQRPDGKAQRGIRGSLCPAMIHTCFVARNTILALNNHSLFNFQAYKYENQPQNGKGLIIINGRFGGEVNVDPVRKSWETFAWHGL